MKRGKKGLAVCLALAMAVTAFSGCGSREEKKPDSIFDGDTDALRIFVREGSTYAEKLQEQFPDIKFDFYRYGGLNSTMTMSRLLENDELGDICFSSLQVTEEVAKEHLVDISGKEVCSRYTPAILSQFDVDGSIYQLPGYITMRDIIYNKGMFEKYGWKEPQSFGELVELCSKIQEETDGITPIVMSGVAGRYYFTTMTSYAQAEFLYTPEGQKWQKNYQEGTAHAEEGFGEGIRMVQELIDAGAFDYDKNFGMRDDELFEKRMLTEEAAMMFEWGGQTPIAKMVEEHTEMEFALIPFRNRAGQAFIGTNIPYYIGISKKLEEAGNEKKLENAMRILDWLSTAEGISALSTDTFSAIFPLRNEENTEVFHIYQDFWDENLDSIRASMLYAGYEDILVPTSDVIAEAMKGERRLDNLSEVIDKIHQDYLTGGTAAIEAGSISDNFTHEETVQIFAEVLYSKGDSDAALVSDGTYKSGVLNTGGVFTSLIKGAMIEDQLTCSLPGERIAEPAVQMKMTGKQLKTLLEKGKRRENENRQGEVSFDYYWAGITVEWKNNLVTCIKRNDGTIIEDDMTCTVTFADHDYTEETEAFGCPAALPYTAKEAFAEYLRKNSPVAPASVLRSSDEK